MSFFTNLRADRLITEIRSSTDQASPALLKAVARLKDLGPGAIEPVFAALPDASTFPSSEKANAVTESVCPSNVLIGSRTGGAGGIFAGDGTGVFSALPEVGGAVTPAISS